MEIRTFPDGVFFAVARTMISATGTWQPPGPALAQEHPSAARVDSESTAAITAIRNRIAIVKFIISRFSLTILRAVLIRLSCPHSSGRDGSPVAPITAYRSFGQTIRLTINSGRYTHDLCARQGVATDLSQSEDLQVGIATSMSIADRRRTDWH